MSISGWDLVHMSDGLRNKSINVLTKCRLPRIGIVGGPGGSPEALLPIRSSLLKPSSTVIAKATTRTDRVTAITMVRWTPVTAPL